MLASDARYRENAGTVTTLTLSDRDMWTRLNQQQRLFCLSLPCYHTSAVMPTLSILGAC